jgi:hypothetical protein
MKRLQLFIYRFLIGWGILCAGIAIVLCIAIAYQFGPGKVSNRTASEHDVRYVLNWCELGDDRIAEVLHSHISAGSFSGDHLEAHAIRITTIELSELVKNDTGAGWFRGDEVTGVVNDALEFVEEWIPSEEIPWFITEEELRSSEVYVYPWSIFYHGTKPSAVKLIFVRPKDKTVFYFASKS